MSKKADKKTVKQTTPTKEAFDKKELAKVIEIGEAVMADPNAPIKRRRLFFTFFNALKIYDLELGKKYQKLSVTPTHKIEIIPIDQYRSKKGKSTESSLEQTGESSKGKGKVGERVVNKHFVFTEANVMEAVGELGKQQILSFASALAGKEKTAETLKSMLIALNVNTTARKESTLLDKLVVRIGEINEASKQASTDTGANKGGDGSKGVGEGIVSDDNGASNESTETKAEGENGGVGDESKTEEG